MATVIAPCAPATSIVKWTVRGAGPLPGFAAQVSERLGATVVVWLPHDGSSSAAASRAARRSDNAAPPHAVYARAASGERMIGASSRGGPHAWVARPGRRHAPGGPVDGGCG